MNIALIAGKQTRADADTIGAKRQGSRHAATVHNPACCNDWDIRERTLDGRQQSRQSQLRFVAAGARPPTTPPAALTGTSGTPLFMAGGRANNPSSHLLWPPASLPCAMIPAIPI